MKKIIETPNAPAPIGPYNQAIEAGPFLFVSGQIPINPASGELVNDSIKSEAKQVMQNLEAILTRAEMNFGNVVKTTIFLRDMNDFVAVNEVYGSFFRDHFPARETVAVAGLPKNVNVEISVVAFRG